MIKWIKTLVTRLDQVTKPRDAEQTFGTEETVTARQKINSSDSSPVKIIVE